MEEAPDKPLWSLCYLYHTYWSWSVIDCADNFFFLEESEVASTLLCLYVWFLTLAAGK